MSDIVKVKVTVELEIPQSVLREYDVVDYREVNQGDLYLSPSFVTCKVWRHLSPSLGSFPILRHKFVWPTWLKCRYIAMDSDDRWFGYNGEPELQETIWSSKTEGGSVLTGDFFDFTPPHVTDWKESKMKNPHG